MRRRPLVLPLLLAVLPLVATACAGGEDASPPPTTAPRADADPADPDPIDPEVEDDQPPVEVGEPADLADRPGRIAVVSDDGLDVVTPTGDRTPLLRDCLGDTQFVALAVGAGSCPTESVSQPTWAPDGRLLAVSVLDAAEPSRSAAVLVDADAADVEILRRTDRPPFFYSWRDDGDRLAALGPGPGPEGGTSLTLIDPRGEVRPDVAQASGVYLAWEPGGDDLAVHDGDDLRLLAGAEADPLVDGLGRAFDTPAWVPRSRRVLTAGEGEDAGLALLDVDTGARSEVTGLDGPVRFVMHPEGDRVAVSHDSPAGADTARAAAVEVIDLATGARTPVFDRPAVWMEWSPDGDRLLVLSIAPGEATWHVRQPDGRVDELLTFLPSRTEILNHLPYYDQYTESPRRWSPDGGAFVFAGEVGGRSGVWVQPVDPAGPVVPLGSGRAAWWSPR